MLELTTQPAGVNGLREKNFKLETQGNEIIMVLLIKWENWEKGLP